MGRRDGKREVRTEVSHQHGHSAAARSQHGIVYWDLYEKLQHRRILELTVATCT